MRERWGDRGASSMRPRFTDHHAIIPTGKVPAAGALGPDEQRLYDLVVRRFLGAFHPDAEFALTEAVIRVGLGAVEPLQADAASGAPAAPDHRERKPGSAPPRTADASGRARLGDEPMLGSLPPPPDRFIARGRVRLVAGWQAVAGFDERAGSGGGPAHRSKRTGARTAVGEEPR